MPKISVLVPVYNVERYLRTCLESIVTQTFSDIEIICMDDGSTDKSGEILDEYARKDKRIRVVHKSNSGYGSTMNQAVSLACGEYIGIVESDDFIAPDMYERLYAAVDKNHLDFVKSDFFRLWTHEDGTKELEYRKLTERMDLYHKVLNPNEEKEAYYLEKFTWNALYRRSFLIEHGIRYHETPGASYQDNGFWFQTFYFARRVMFLNQAFYHYKQDNPDSSINSSKKVYAMKQEYDYIHEFLLRQGEGDKELFEICFYFRLDGYLFTLSMLDDQYKLELANMIKRECDVYEQKGEANFHRFSKDRLELIQQLKDDPVQYVDKQIFQNTQIRTLLNRYRHIIIYGAGACGKRVYRRIKRVINPEIAIDFAVTSLNGRLEYCYSNTVRELSEFERERNTCMVILSVKEESQAYREMKSILEKMGFRNVISYKLLFY